MHGLIMIINAAVFLFSAQQFLCLATSLANFVTIQAVTRHYQNAIKGPELKIDIEGDRVSLDIPEDGLLIVDSQQLLINLVPMTPLAVS